VKPEKLRCLDQAQLALALAVPSLVFLVLLGAGCYWSLECLESHLAAALPEVVWATAAVMALQTGSVQP